MGNSIDSCQVAKSYFDDAESFHLAFQILKENSSDPIFYPQLYLLRHSVELCLKSLIFESPNGLSQLPPIVSKKHSNLSSSNKVGFTSNVNRHSIKDLFVLLISDFPEYQHAAWYRWIYVDIKEIDLIDSHDDFFRYSTGNDYLIRRNSKIETIDISKGDSLPSDLSNFWLSDDFTGDLFLVDTPQMLKIMKKLESIYLTLSQISSFYNQP